MLIYIYTIYTFFKQHKVCF